nr:MAG TPA: hypothetical protein [Caudoviricetes sp.]
MVLGLWYIIIANKKDKPLVKIPAVLLFYKLILYKYYYIPIYFKTYMYFYGLYRRN